MGTEELRATILREAEAEAAELVESARAKALQAIDAEKRRLEDHRWHVLEERKQRVVHDRVVGEASLKVELRNALLLRKQQLIEDVFSEAERNIQLDASLYSCFLRWAINQIPLLDASTHIVCRKEDRETIQSLLAERFPARTVEIESPAGATQLGLTVSLADSEIDLTLRAACENLREHALLNVASGLFRAEA